MEPEILCLDSLDRMVLNTGALYLIFGYGTGDTFNALIHLQKAMPVRDYELIIKRPQLNLVRFLSGLFDRPPVRIIAVDYWKHDFSAHITARFPTLPFVRGIEPHSARSGFIDCWLAPSLYNKLIPLTDDDVARLVAHFRHEPPAMRLPPNAVVFFPTAGTNFSDYIPPWERMAATLRACGLEHIYVNDSGVSDYGNEAIPGVRSLNLPHDELMRMFYDPATTIKMIAVRSGVLDILRFCGQRALVLYQPVPEGIFDTCRFGLLRHNLDMVETICLNTSADHQDQVLDFYLRRFIASPLER